MSIVVVIRSSDSYGPPGAFLVVLPGRHLRAGRAQRLPYLPPGAAAHRRQVELRRDAGLCRGGLCGAAGVHVVRVLVGALVVVGDQDLRTVLGDEAADPARHFLERHVPERVRPVLVLPVRHARVVVAERFHVADLEDPGRLFEFGQTQPGDCLRVVAGLAGLDPAGGVPVLAVGAGDNHCSDALVGVGSEDAATGRLVVGVGVYRHQGERLCHTHQPAMPRPGAPSGRLSRPAVPGRSGRPAAPTR